MSPRWLSAALALAALAGASCEGACLPERAAAPPVLPEPAAPQAAPLSVEVLAGTGPDRRGLAGVEVRAIPAAEMDSHLVRRAAAAARLAALRAEEARLAAEVARQRRENDATNQAYLADSAAYLRERAALNLGQHAAGDVIAARKAAAQRRVSARFKASQSARSSLEAEHRLERLVRERAALQATLLEELPAEVATGTTGPGGLVELSLRPGTYAIVGLAPAAAGRPPRTWLAWVDVADALPPRLVLDDAAGSREDLAGPAGGETP